MRRDSFGLAKQPTFGTKVTAMEHFPPVASADVKDVSENIIAEETTGTRFPARLEKGVRGWEVSAKGSARPQSLVRLLQGFLGTPVKTNPYSGDAGAYSYLFDPVTSDPSFMSLLATMKDPNPNIVALLYDAIGSSLTLSLAPSGFLSFEADYFAASYDGTQAAPTPTLDVSKRFTFDQAVCRATIDGGAENIIPVAGFQLSFSNNEDRGSKALGQRGLYDLVATNAEAEVQFTPKTALSAEFARALQDDPSQVKLRLTATGGLIGTAPYLFEVIVHCCEYLEAPAGANASNRLNSIPVRARAAYDTVAGKFLTVQVVNSTSITP